MKTSMIAALAVVFSAGAMAQATPPGGAAPAPAAAPAATPAPAAPVRRYNVYAENKKGQDALAKRDYKTAIRIFTENLDSGKLADNWVAPTLHLRGRAFRLSRQPDKALADYEAAVKKDPKLDNSWYEMALVYHQRENYARAIDSYSKAIELKPANHLYWYGRCASRLFLNKLKDAETDCKKALEIKPDYVPALSSLGRVYEDGKQKQKALETYRRVLELDPGNKDAKNGIEFLNSPQSR
jgi:tetratricopeptide (TPR) repeat protein